MANLWTNRDPKNEKTTRAERKWEAKTGGNVGKGKGSGATERNVDAEQGTRSERRYEARTGRNPRTGKGIGR